MTVVPASEELHTIHARACARARIRSPQNPSQASHGTREHRRYADHPVTTPLRAATGNVTHAFSSSGELWGICADQRCIPWMSGIASTCVTVPRHTPHRRLTRAPREATRRQHGSLRRGRPHGARRMIMSPGADVLIYEDETEAARCTSTSGEGDTVQNLVLSSRRNTSCHNGSPLPCPHEPWTPTGRAFAK